MEQVMVEKLIDTAIKQLSFPIHLIQILKLGQRF